jgi:hypothetical protein
VPVSIDSVTCQALFQRQGRNGAIITTPLELADALSRLATPVPPTPAPPPAHRGADRMGRGPETGRTARHAGPQPVPHPDPPAWGAGPPERPRAAYQRGGTRHRGGAAAKSLIGAVVVLVLAAVIAAAWSFSRPPVHGTPQAGRHSRSAGPSTAASVMLKPVSAHGFDPLSGDPGNEDDAGAHFAIDGDPSTSWDTQYYKGNPVFGGLKKGTGLILDMGKQVRLSQVQVQFGSICCAAVQIELGNDNTRSAATLNTFTPVASSSKAASETTFPVTSSAKGRYVLIWLTSLPPMAGSPGQFMTQVYNVVVHGSS